MVSNRFSTLTSKRLCVVNTALASFYFLATVSCSSPVESGCTVHLSGPRPTDQISILSYNENGHTSRVDSILPTDSIHVIRCHDNQLLILSIYGSPIYFIAEKGDITIDFRDGSVQGAPLNDAKLQFETTYNKLLSEASAKYDSVATITWLSLDDKNAELAQISKQEAKLITDYVMTQVISNKDNALGQYAFLFGIARNSLVGAEDYDKFLTKAGANVSQCPPVQYATTIIHNAIETAAGCDVKDIHVVMPDGKQAQLASFMEDGCINVIHVFDPYNSATPKTLQHISKIKNEIERLGRSIDKSSSSASTHTHVKFFSVCEYVGEDIVKKITERFNPDWVIASDSCANFVHDYGITTLPYFIIVDEDGKIGERGVGEDALFNWVYSKMLEGKHIQVKQ